jgi:hypothetical protein
MLARGIDDGGLVAMHTSRQAAMTFHTPLPANDQMTTNLRVVHAHS